MPLVQFGQRTCYVVQGGDVAQRYAKRQTFMSTWPLHDPSRVEVRPDKTLIQVLTGGMGTFLDSDEEVILEAKREGNLFDLDA